MIYWMYFLPLWLSGLITIVVFCAFGVTGLALTRRWAPSLHHATVSYNDIIGYFFGRHHCSLWHHARPAHARGNVANVARIANDLAAFEVTAVLSGALWVLV